MTNEWFYNCFVILCLSGVRSVLLRDERFWTRWFVVRWDFYWKLIHGLLVPDSVFRLLCLTLTEAIGVNKFVLYFASRRGLVAVLCTWVVRWAGPLCAPPLRQAGATLPLEWSSYGAFGYLVTTSTGRSGIKR